MVGGRCGEGTGGLRARLVSDPNGHDVRPPNEPAAGQLLAPWRHQRHGPDGLPAHHALHPGHLRQHHRHRLQRPFHHPGQTMKKIVSYARSQRSQGLTEFAIIAPIILLLTFRIIDFGRALYVYITLQQAANDGARVALPASYFIDPNGSSHNWPKNSDVVPPAQGHAGRAAMSPPPPHSPPPNSAHPQPPPLP